MYKLIHSTLCDSNDLLWLHYLLALQLPCICFLSYFSHIECSIDCIPLGELSKNEKKNRQKVLSSFHSRYSE